MLNASLKHQATQKKVYAYIWWVKGHFFKHVIFKTFIFLNSVGSSDAVSASILPSSRNLLSLIWVINWLVKGVGTFKPKIKTEDFSLWKCNPEQASRQNSLHCLVTDTHVIIGSEACHCVKLHLSVDMGKSLPKPAFQHSTFRAFTFYCVHRPLFCHSGKWHWMVICPVFFCYPQGFFCHLMSKW